MQRKGPLENEVKPRNALVIGQSFYTFLIYSYIAFHPITTKFLYLFCEVINNTIEAACMRGKRNQLKETAKIN